MYKYFLVLCITFFLSACSFSVSFGDTQEVSDFDNEMVNESVSDSDTEKSEATELDDSQSDEIVDGDVEVNETQKKVVNYEVYRKWMIDEPYKDENKYDFYSFDNLRDEDCVSLWNGETYGGDLLSNLVLQDNLSPRVKLHSYTPEYVANLEQKIAAYTQKKYDRNFYASYVCNYGDKQDLAVGFLWPQATKTCKNNSCFGEKAQATLVYVSGEKVYDYQDIRYYNQTATGGEVNVCGAEDMDDYFLWECFMGWDPDKGLEYYKAWDIKKDGTISESREYNQKMNF